MRISNITPQISTQNYKRKTTATNTHVSNPQKNIERFGYVPSVSFKAMHNIKQKTIDTELETKKLLKQFDDILASDMSLEELIHLYERKVIASKKAKGRGFTGRSNKTYGRSVHKSNESRTITGNTKRV